MNNDLDIIKITQSFIPQKNKNPEILKDLKILDHVENLNHDIIKNFEMMMKSLLTRSLIISNKKQQLSGDDIVEFNSNFQNPISVNFKRAQLTSYPNVNAVYWLLRFTRILSLKPHNGSLYTQIDEVLAKKWFDLSEIEKYFTLFEIWIAWFTTNIFEEFDRFGYPTVIYILHIMECLISQKIQKDSIVNYLTGYGTYNIALCEMFGFVKIQNDPPLANGRWNFSSMEITQKGNNIARFLKAYCLGFEVSSNFKYKDFSKFKKLLNPYITQWINTFPVKQRIYLEGEFYFCIKIRKKTHVFKLTHNDTLELFADQIIVRLDLEYDHLYEFIINDFLSCTIQHFIHEICELGRNMRFCKDTKISELPLEVGQTFQFHYDFGTLDIFDITLDKILPYTMNSINSTH